MKTWKCVNPNPGWQATGKCGADAKQHRKSMSKPKDTCPNCGKKTFWQEVLPGGGAAAAAPAAVLAWPDPLPQRLVTALAGSYVSAETNNAGDAAEGPCNTTYGGGKHWGSGALSWEAGQYDIPAVNANIVLGLETKAVRIGLETAGGYIFKFSINVGHTCRKGNNKGLPHDATTCIRVDGGTTVATGMHSHPIPEWGGLTTSSHEKEVKSVIITAVNTLDTVKLAEVAEYLTIIGATHGSYRFTTGEQQKLANPLPTSVFW